MRSLILIALFTLLAANASARTYGWIQFYDPEIEKKALGEQTGNPVDLLIGNRTANVEIQEIEKQLRAKDQNNAKVKSDLAGVLLLMHGVGAAEQAIALLRDAEKLLPNEYIIAINAATALELGNFYEEASHWLSEAKRRNSQPHLGSEWLQALIVSAKEQIQAEPEWLDSNTVLGADFGERERPQLPRMSDANFWVQRAKHALFQQIRGRMRFSPPPDQVIGDLLFDFANIELIKDNRADAMKLYQMAIDYDTPRRQLASQRLQAVTPPETKDAKGFPGSRPLVVGLTMLVFAFLIWFGLKKLRENDTLPKS